MWIEEVDWKPGRMMKDSVRRREPIPDDVRAAFFGRGLEANEVVGQEKDEVRLRGTASEVLVAREWTSDICRIKMGEWCKWGSQLILDPEQKCCLAWNKLKACGKRSTSRGPSHNRPKDDDVISYAASEHEWQCSVGILRQRSNKIFHH